jgi:hypothetical protein
MTMESRTPVSPEQVSKRFDEYLEAFLLIISARHKNNTQSHSHGMHQLYIPRAMWRQCGSPYGLKKPSLIRTSGDADWQSCLGALAVCTSL